MSRFGDNDGDYFQNQSELWWANAERALNGKRGRKALAELREALLALPEKRLIEGALSTVGATAEAEAMPEVVPSWDGAVMVTNWKKEELLDLVEREGEGVCAIGAYVWWKKVKDGASSESAFAELPRLRAEDGGDYETAMLAKSELGLTFTLAWTLAYRNDEQLGGLTAEARYDQFLAWINQCLGEDVAA